MKLKICCILLFLINGFLFYTYEDQIGEIDWYRQNVGEMLKVQRNSHSIFITTKNRFASIHLENGKILWRKSLEAPIKFYYEEQISIIPTISSNNTALHVWNQKGSLLWDLKLKFEKRFQDISYINDRLIIILLTNSIQIRDTITGKLIWKSPKV